MEWIKNQKHCSKSEGMNEEDRVTVTGEPVSEGELRLQNVTVGMHMPPDFNQIPTFL
jgi:hypothetical protein